MVLNNFLAVKDKYAHWDNTRVVILPVPYGRTVSYRKGAEKGPKAIINASSQVELYDDELCIHTYKKVGISTLKPLNVKKLSPSQMVIKVETKVAKVIKERKFPVLLGGEHSITLGAVKALKNKYKNLAVLQLDAHADLRDSYLGSRYNHACIAKRISEIVDIVQLGIRSLCSKEAAVIKKSKNILSIKAADIVNEKPWKKKIADKLSKNVYITVDLDVLNPAEMPGVGTPEPGGLSWYEVLKIIKYVSKIKNVVGFDVVELSPIKGQNVSEFTAAKLVYRMIGYIQASDCKQQITS